MTKERETKRTAIYVRVSTSEQRVDAQLTELREYARQRGWIVHKVYSDEGMSGMSKTRPGLNALLADAQQRKFDVVLVWKFDRFARSVSNLVTALDLFKSLHIDFCSRTEAVDTTLPMGQLVFHIFGAIAQFERELIRERTRAGLREARRKGKRLGRPSAAPLEAGQAELILKKRHEKKVSLRKLARDFGIPLWRIHAVCKEGTAHV